MKTVWVVTGERSDSFGRRRWWVSKCFKERAAAEAHFVKCMEAIKSEVNPNDWMNSPSFHMDMVDYDDGEVPWEEEGA